MNGSNKIRTHKNHPPQCAHTSWKFTFAFIYDPKPASQHSGRSDIVRNGIVEMVKSGWEKLAGARKKRKRRTERLKSKREIRHSYSNVMRCMRECTYGVSRDGKNAVRNKFAVDVVLVCACVCRPHTGNPLQKNERRETTHFVSHFLHECVVSFA